jgi:hypothetical protein
VAPSSRYTWYTWYTTVTWYTIIWWWITGWPFIGPERAQLVLCWLVETSIWLDERRYSKL